MSPSPEKPSIPVEHVKNAEELVKEIDLHAAFIMREVKRKGILRLTVNGEEAVELASTLFQLTSLVRSKEQLS